MQYEEAVTRTERLSGTELVRYEPRTDLVRMVQGNLYWITDEVAYEAVLYTSTAKGIIAVPYGSYEGPECTSDPRTEDRVMPVLTNNLDEIDYQDGLSYENSIRAYADDLTTTTVMDADGTWHLGDAVPRTTLDGLLTGTKDTNRTIQVIDQYAGPSLDPQIMAQYHSRLAMLKMGPDGNAAQVGSVKIGYDADGTPTATCSNFKCKQTVRFSDAPKVWTLRVMQEMFTGWIYQHGNTCYAKHGMNQYGYEAKRLSSEPVPSLIP